MFPHLTVYNFELFCTWMAMSDPAHCRFVVLISGQGSNMRAIVEACRDKTIAGTVVAVIANRPDCLGLQWAASQGIEVAVVSHRDFDSRDAFDRALAAAIDEFDPHYVLMAGFMRVLTRDFVDRYAGRLVNIHPSLLPAFPGLHTHQQALSSGVRVHGCTVHFVTPVLDHGPIIAQGVVAVLDTDTPDSLAARVLELEHLVYGQVCEWLAAGRVEITSDRVEVRDIAHRLFFGTHLE